MDTVLKFDEPKNHFDAFNALGAAYHAVGHIPKQVSHVLYVLTLLYGQPTEDLPCHVE